MGIIKLPAIHLFSIFCLDNSTKLWFLKTSALPTENALSSEILTSPYLQENSFFSSEHQEAGKPPLSVPFSEPSDQNPDSSKMIWDELLQILLLVNFLSIDEVWGWFFKILNSFRGKPSVKMWHLQWKFVDILRRILRNKFLKYLLKLDSSRKKKNSSKHSHEVKYNALVLHEHSSIIHRLLLAMNRLEILIERMRKK